MGLAILALAFLIIAFVLGTTIRDAYEESVTDLLTFMVIFMLAGALFAFWTGGARNENKKWGEAVPSNHLIPSKILTTVKTLGNDLFIVKPKGADDKEGKIFRLDEKVKGRELLKEGEDFIIAGGTIYSPPPEIST